MVGPAVQRVTSAEDLTKSEQHAEKHSSQAAPRAAAVPHYNNNYQRQQQQQHQHSKHHHHYSGSDSGKRNGSQRASAAAQNQRGSDYRLGGVPDVSARTSMPSSASPSGRPPHSNLDRFLEVTTPSVKSQTLRKVSISSFFTISRAHTLWCLSSHPKLATFDVCPEADGWLLGPGSSALHQLGGRVQCCDGGDDDDDDPVTTFVPLWWILNCRLIAWSLRNWVLEVQGFVAYRQWCLFL